MTQQHGGPPGEVLPGVVVGPPRRGTVKPRHPNVSTHANLGVEMTNAPEPRPKFNEHPKSLANTATPEQRAFIEKKRREYREQRRELERYHANGDVSVGSVDSHIDGYEEDEDEA